MKTPNRTRATVSKFATAQDCLNARARYKRKNRTAQLKRTITRLTQENEQLKYILASNLIEQDLKLFNDTARSIFKDIQKHLRISTLQDPPAELLEENGKQILHIRHNPIVVTWDEAPIGPVAPWYKIAKSKIQDHENA